MKLSVLKAYKFRIYPNEQQKKFFIQTFGCVRFTYNQLLKAKVAELAADSATKMKPLTPAKLKREYPFLKETDSLALANAQRNLERAFRNYFQRRAGFPKLKTKKSIWQSYTTNNQQHTIYFDENQLKLPKLKTLVMVNLHREIKGNIKSATITAKNGEEFYVSILCTEEIQPLPRVDRSIGIVFCPHNLVQANQDIPIFSNTNGKLEVRLVKAEKRLSVKAKAVKRKKILLGNAKNYQKQKLKVARLYQANCHRKKDFIDQITYYLVKKYDTIFVEVVHEEAPLGHGTYGLSDWHLFIRKVKYKAEWYGRNIQFISLTQNQQKKLEELQQWMHD